jgi:hypothetical protein
MTQFFMFCFAQKNAAILMEMKCPADRAVKTHRRAICQSGGQF